MATKLAIAIITLVALIGAASASLHVNDVNVYLNYGPEVNSMSDLNGTTYRAVEYYDGVVVQLQNQKSTIDETLKIGQVSGLVLTQYGTIKNATIYTSDLDSDYKYLAVYYVLDKYTVIVTANTFEDLVAAIEVLTITRSIYISEYHVDYEILHQGANLPV